MHTTYYIIRAHVYNNIQVPLHNSTHKRPDRIVARRPIVSERVFIAAAAQTAANPDCRSVTIFLFFFFFRFFFSSAVHPPHPAPNASRRIISTRMYDFFSRFRKTVVYCLNQFYRRGGRLRLYVILCRHTNTHNI